MARPRDDDDDDTAPWLAEADSHTPASTMVSQRRLFGGIGFAFLLVLLVAVGLYVIVSKKQGGADGIGTATPTDVPLIAADPGPYKVAPAEANRGGMKVDGNGQTIYSAGSGEDPNGQIDASRTPEEALPRPGVVVVPTAPPPTDLLPAAMGGPVGPPPAAAAPVAAPAPKLPAAGASVSLTTPKPLVAKPAAPVALPPVSAGTSKTLQLGAFSSAAKAEQVWKQLSGRYAYLAPLTKRIEAVERDGGTLYRLRAIGAPDHAAAMDLCARLKVAGDSCMVTE